MAQICPGCGKRLGENAKKDKLCERCARARAGYFESVLQLRNKKNTHFEEALKLAEDIIKGSDARVTKTVPQKDGTDLYLDEKKTAKTIGKRLYSNYGGEHKLTRSLFSRKRDTQKNIYRDTVLVRLSDIEPGDVILKANRPFRVERVFHDKLSATDLMHGKKTQFTAGKEEQHIKRGDISRMQVIRRRPNIEVLDPGSYQPRKIENPGKADNKEKIEKGEESMPVVEIEGKLYCV